MDASILQLFTAEDVLKRLTKISATGAFHAYTSKEAANVFFQDGVIIGAGKGLMEGEEVIQRLLEWKDAHFIWQEGQTPAPGMRTLELNFPEVAARMLVASKLEGGGKTTPESKLTEVRAIETKPSDSKLLAKSVETSPLISLPSRAVSTGPMTMNKTNDMSKPFDDAPPLQPVEVTKQNLVPVTTSLSATKTISTRSRDEDSFEEALMRKHQLALASVGETPPQRLRIIRSSNLVGRNPACDFTLNHGSISRQHCLLQIMERGLHVKDLSSSNGTKVNGIPLTEGYVSVGDKLTIGHLDFVVEKDEPPAV